MDIVKNVNDFFCYPLIMIINQIRLYKVVQIKMSVRQKQVFFDVYSNDLEEVKNDVLKLNQLSPGSQGTIVKVPENNLLAALGVRKGKTIKVENIQPLGGPMVIEINSRSLAIGREVAEQIKVGSLKNV